MRRLHATVGGVFLAVFLATGVYMKARFPALYQGDQAMRMMFRSAHIYLLFSALLNLSAGTRWAPAGTPWRARLQAAGSLMLLTAPPLFTASFFLESGHDVHRSIAMRTVELCLAGALLHAAAAYSPKGTAR
jgi:hypothetical protein